MIVKSFGCDSCDHSQVCGIKKDRERLITEMERMAQRQEFSVFHMRCVCDHWSGRQHEQDQL